MFSSFVWSGLYAAALVLIALVARWSGADPPTTARWLSVMGLPVSMIAAGYGIWESTPRNPTFVMPLFLKIFIFGSISFVIYPELPFWVVIPAMLLSAGSVALFSSAEFAIPFPDHDPHLMPWWQTAAIVLMGLYGVLGAFHEVQSGNPWFVVAISTTIFLGLAYFLLKHPYYSRSSVSNHSNGLDITA